MNLREAIFSAILLAASGSANAQMQTGRYLFLHQGEEVLDTKTQLIWRRCVTGMNLSQDRCVGKAGTLDFSGLPDRHTPWRVPTLAELLSLVERPSPAGGAGKLYINEAVFPDTPDGRSAAAGGFGGTMRYVDFTTGRPGGSRPLNYPVRAVRETSTQTWEEIRDNKLSR